MRSMEKIDYPQTAEEWWAVVEYYQVDLRTLVTVFHPYYRNAPGLPITAPKAEQACEEAREEIRSQEQDDPLLRFEEYRKGKNAELANLLNDVWFGMPESVAVREEPGFGVLCDLCSEAYVLEH